MPKQEACQGDSPHDGGALGLAYRECEIGVSIFPSVGALLQTRAGSAGARPHRRAAMPGTGFAAEGDVSISKAPVVILAGRVAALRPVSRQDGGSLVPMLCLVVFLLVWVGLAIAPRYRADWLLENLPVFVAVPAAVAGYARFRFSNLAYLQATLFAILHTLGSHYTYSEVPLGDWLRDLLGFSRNHYDRLVHFAFGLLMLRPVCELGFRGRPLGRFAAAYFGVAGVACWSLAYEVVEWLVAAVADPSAGTAYLGTQGDVWDAQKDMALALGGAAVAALLEWRFGMWREPVRAESREDR